MRSTGFSAGRKMPANITPATASAHEPAVPATAERPARAGWLSRLGQGLRRTGQSISSVFTGTRIDDNLYEDLEAALLMADAGVAATEYLLADLHERVKQTRTTEPSAVKALLAQALTDVLRPLEHPLTIGQHQPTVIMVAGVNGEIGRAHV